MTRCGCQRLEDTMADTCPDCGHRWEHHHASGCEASSNAPNHTAPHGPTIDSQWCICGHTHGDHTPRLTCSRHGCPCTAYEKRPAPQETTLGQLMREASAAEGPLVLKGQLHWLPVRGLRRPSPTAPDLLNTAREAGQFPEGHPFHRSSPWTEEAVNRLWEDIENMPIPWTHRARMYASRFVHNVVAHPLLMLCPPVGEWLHRRTEP